MSYRPRLLGLLTPAQSEVLKTLYELRDQTSPDTLWRPKDLGAYRSSHHALTLKRLLDRGWVERTPSDEGSRSFSYRITEAGVSTWELLRDVSQAPVLGVFGGALSRPRSELLTRLAA